MRWREKLKRLAVTWLQLEQADGPNQRLAISWHGFDANGEQMLGLGVNWSQELREMSEKRLALVLPLVERLHDVALAVLRQHDLWYEGQDAALRLVQVGRYAEGGIGINVARYYDGEDEFVGQLVFEQRAERPMKLNQRQAVRATDEAEIKTALEGLMAQADQMAWKLRVEGIK